MIQSFVRALGIFAISIGCFQLGVSVTTSRWAKMHADCIAVVRECDAALKQELDVKIEESFRYASPSPTPLPSDLCWPMSMEPLKESRR